MDAYRTACYHLLTTGVAFITGVVVVGALLLGGQSEYKDAHYAIAFGASALGLGLWIALVAADIRERTA